MNPIDKHNNKYLKEWDIEEDDGFTEVSVFNRIYKVRAGPLAFECAKLLYFIDDYIDALKTLVKDIPEMQLFLETDYEVQEISDQVTFEGINKPKNIGLKDDNYISEYDEPYRAGNRLIMLSLQEEGKVRDWEKVEKLLLHELAHTACNHLRYYVERNHRDDFKRAERILKKASKSITYR